eukprot:scaffold91658_cov15-Tisochrysis_lutea.AAC.1
MFPFSRKPIRRSCSLQVEHDAESGLLSLGTQDPSPAPTRKQFRRKKWRCRACNVQRVACACISMLSLLFAVPSFSSTARELLMASNMEKLGLPAEWAGQQGHKLMLEVSRSEAATLQAHPALKSQA